MEIKGNLQTAQAILARLKAVQVNLGPLLDSPITGLDSLLKGMDFRVKNLSAAKRCFDNARDDMGRVAFYYNNQFSSGSIIKELIRNAPSLIDMSFAATDGFGYREIRDMPMLPSLPEFQPTMGSSKFSSRFGFEDEETRKFEVTSVHAALNSGKCNVHIDEIGFVVRGPHGVFLNPDFPQHLVDELGSKTFLLPKLRLGLENRLTIDMPNHRNGYRPGAGVSVQLTPRLTISAKYTAKCGYCREREEDVRFPIPDGWSVGVGVTYRFGEGSKQKRR